MTSTDPQQPEQDPGTTTWREQPSPETPTDAPATNPEPAADAFGPTSSTPDSPPTDAWSSSGVYLKGPSPVTLVAGLLFTAVAVLCGLSLLDTIQLDWDVALPAVVIGAGVLFCLAGSLSLVSRRRRSAADAPRT